MKLYEEILMALLKEGKIDLLTDVNAAIESACYQALQKIKEILEDDRLNDEECFRKIEEIVCVLEGLGSDAGTRHDFG